MVGFLRFFILFALLVIVAIAAYAQWALPGLTMPSIMQLIEKSNNGFAEGYISTVWKKHREAMLQLLAGDPQLLENNPEVAQFAQETAQYFQPMPVLRTNIYTSAGVLLLTIDGNSTDKLGSVGPSPNALFVIDHLKEPSAISTVIAEAHTSIGQEMLVQTVAPIRMTKNATTEGAVEIISNMSNVPQILAQYQEYAIHSIVGVSIFFLLLLLLGLFVILRRSEGIITKQHEANLELIEAVAAAQAENRDKSQFLANVSHELRTPLNAIIGFSEILKNEVTAQLTDKKYENYISDIHVAGVHLLSLINDILDYSKAEAGKLELEVSEVNANKQVQNSLRLVSPRAETGQITLVEKLPNEQLIMSTDSKKFKQVLLNLLSNAVKFTPAGGEVTVSAWHNVADDTFSFEVKDTGIGIAPKDISRAMAPFSQIDNTLKRKFEGTGLGLPLTKKFVELMGGKFNIESEVNKGTKITFTLPRTVKPRDGLIIKQAT